MGWYMLLAKVIRTGWVAIYCSGSCVEAVVTANGIFSPGSATATIVIHLRVRRLRAVQRATATLLPDLSVGILPQQAIVTNMLPDGYRRKCRYTPCRRVRIGPHILIDISVALRTEHEGVSTLIGNPATTTTLALRFSIEFDRCGWG